MVIEKSKANKSDQNLFNTQHYHKVYKKSCNKKEKKISFYFDSVVSSHLGTSNYMYLALTS